MSTTESGNTTNSDNLNSTWTSFRQKVSSAFRSTFQVLETHYIDSGESFSQFEEKTANDISNDLQAISAEVELNFHTALATALLEYAKAIFTEDTPYAQWANSFLIQDSELIGNLNDFIQSEYESFAVFKADEIDNLSALLITNSTSSPDFYELFASMLVSQLEIDIWDRFILSFPNMDDREAELFVDFIRLEEGLDIQSFRSFTSFSSDDIGSVIKSESEVEGSEAELYVSFLAESLIAEATLVYQNFGEGNTDADLWEAYLERLPEEKASAINVLIEEGTVGTVYDLSIMSKNDLLGVVDDRFFNAMFLYYKSSAEFVEENYAFQYRFIGRLLNNEDNSPLSSWQVKAVDANDTDYGSINLGSTVTNNNGYFEVFFSVLTKLSLDYQLDFTLIDPESGQEYSMNNNYQPSNANNPVDFEVNVVTVLNSAAISDVESIDNGLTIPVLLSDYLSTNNINSLEDVRKFKGLASKADLPSGTEDEATRLDSHAILELLKGNREESKYILENAGLIDKDFVNIQSIAKSNRYNFVKKSKSVFSSQVNTGQYEAGKIYEQAGAALEVFNSRLNDGLTTQFKDYSTDPDIIAALRSIAPNPCQCEDCKSGVSPLAYLSDLLNYAINNTGKIGRLDSGEELEINDSKIHFQSGEIIEIIQKNNVKVTLSTGSIILINNDEFTLPSGAVYKSHSIEVQLPDGSTEVLGNQVNTFYTGDVFSHTSLPGIDITLDSGETVTIPEADYYAVILPSGIKINAESSTVSMPNEEEFRLDNLPAAQLNLRDIQDLLLHPFADLPVDCSSVNKKICQIRVAIEVLWSNLFNYIDEGNPNNITSSDDLTTHSKLKELRLKTYEFLLSEMGTSYEELRKIRSASIENRNELADRIGILENRIDEFILDHSSGNNQINDHFLEELFGFRDVSRNYRTTETIDGETVLTALAPLPKSKLKLYREEFLRKEFHKQDFPEKPYSSTGRPIIDPDIIGPDDFRNPDPDALPFSLWQDRFDFLSRSASELKSLKRKASVFPRSKKLIVSDFPSSDTLPNVIGITDQDNQIEEVTPFKMETRPNGNTIFTVLEKLPSGLKDSSDVIIDGVAYNQGGEELNDLSYDYEFEGIANEKSIFNRMKEPFIYNEESFIPWDGNAIVTNHEEYFELLYGNLKNKQFYNQSITAINSVLGYDEAQFLRLYELYEKNKIGISDFEADSLTAEEWNEVVDLMLVSIKQKLNDKWLQEEGTSVKIDPTTFWEPITDPISGEHVFPTENTFFDNSSALPLVDPELINLKDLPDITAGRYGIALFSDRQQEIVNAKAAIRFARINNQEDADLGFNNLMTVVFGIDLTALIDDTDVLLNSNNPAEYYSGEQRILNEYRLSIEQFASLIAIKTKCVAADPADQPTDDEWNSLYASLFFPYKVNNLYEGWRTEEKDNYFSVLDSQSIPKNYTWKLRKVTNIKWRFNENYRLLWKRELQLQSRQPVIDPYVINPLFMKDIGDQEDKLSLNNPVLRKWDDRFDYIEAVRQATLLAIDGNNLLVGVDDRLNTLLNISIGDFLLIKDEQEAGLSTKKRLQQIGLDLDTYDQLYNLRSLAEQVGDNSFTTDEKNDFANILADVHRARQYGAWNDEERDENDDLNSEIAFALSPDYFREFPYSSSDQFLRTEVDNLSYRSDQKGLKQWRRKLRSRKSTLELAIEKINNGLSETENIILIPVRDAIIEHMVNVATPVLITPEDPVNPGATRSVTIQEMKDFINRNLLIDVNMNCCSPTTRATQAIEALQILLWGMYNQTLLDQENVGRLKLLAHDFEKDWKWMGSYATWRSAMFVQLYPENILLPELRTEYSTIYKKFQRDLFNNKRDRIGIVDSANSFVDEIQAAANCLMLGIALAKVKPSFYNSDNNSLLPESVFIGVAAHGSTYKYITYKEVSRDIQTVKLWEDIYVGDEYTYAGHSYFNSGMLHKCIFLFHKDDGVKIELLYKVLNLITVEWEDDISEKIDLPDPLHKLSLTANNKKGDNIDMYMITRSPDGKGQCYLRSIHPFTNEVIYDNILLRDFDRNLNKFDLHGLAKIKNPLGGRNFTFVMNCSEDFLVNEGLSHDGRNIVTMEKYELNNGQVTKSYQFGHPGKMSAAGNQLQIISPSSGGDDFLVLDSTRKRLKADYWVGTSSFSINEYEPFESGSYRHIPLFSYLLDFYPVGKFPVFYVKPKKEGENSYTRAAFSFVDFDWSSTVPLLSSISVPKEIQLNLYEENSKTIIRELKGGRKTDVKNAYENQHDLPFMTYVKELYFFMPLTIGRALQNLGDYDNALLWYNLIYDQNLKEPKISHELVLDSLKGSDFQVNSLPENPLQPHDVAIHRKDAYLKYTLISIASLLVEYADHEFVQDTVESIARAKQLYMEAEELIAKVKPVLSNCNVEYDIQISDPNGTYLREFWEREIKTELESLPNNSSRQALISQIDSIWLASNESSNFEKLVEIKELVQSEIASNSVTITVEQELNSMSQKLDEATFLLAGETFIEKQITQKVSALSSNFESAVLNATGFKEATITSNRIDMEFFENPGASMLEQDGREVSFKELFDQDPVNPDSGGSLGEEAQKDPERILQISYSHFRNPLNSNPAFRFCVATNPIIKAYELQVQLGLFKIHNCLNFSGIKREIDAFAAPSDATTGIPTIGADRTVSTSSLPEFIATPYRFDFLIQQSKELINISQSIESAFLQALEKLDDENLNLLRTRQDLENAKANIKLQDLRVDEAKSGIELAELQTGRAENIVEELDSLIAEGLLSSERSLIKLYDNLNSQQRSLASLSSDYNTVRMMVDILGSGGGVSAAASVASAMTQAGIGAIVNSSIANTERTISSLQKNISVGNLFASFERKVQDWNYQKFLAKQDIQIGRQQEIIAENRLRVVDQERSIAGLRQEQTEATLDFLLNQQFTSAALYQYIVDVLESVYNYFLQEATATAKLAVSQLAFERQQSIPGFIAGDYWITGQETPSAEEKTKDNKGITGSARLLQDIYRLDQYAKQTDLRRQQISKTISLSTIAPLEFERFKETGILTFSTDMELFDRDFPGHYLRLIKQVRTSVIALVPPVDGIKASLSSLGLSRVVTGGPLFQERDIRRTPETISLSSSLNDTGMLELKQDNSMLNPFEGSGVETFWEFRMEKGANPNVDYSSIGDILLTIDYESLISFDYRARVVSRLNNASLYQAMLPISFRNNLPDQWFDIFNPDSAAEPFAVSFDIRKDNFPINVGDLAMDRILLYFPQKNNENKTIKINSFSFSDTDGAELISLSNQEANDAELRISANGIGVDGTFFLSLTGDPTLIRLIDEERLSDILMVITFTGEVSKYNL